MLKNVLVLLCGLMLSSGAFAQDYGALIGFHQTEPEGSEGVGTGGKLNFKAGLAVNFGLTDSGTFRTGVIYTQRNFDVSVAATEYDAKFTYLDIPALYQHRLGEMFSIFGGLVFGVNVADDLKGSGNNNIELDTETLIPLLAVGVNLMFDDQIGFDFYFERGMGTVSEVKNSTVEFEQFNTFGANFVYLF